MTLEEFQKFCEKQAQKEAEKKKVKNADILRRLQNKRYCGNFKDFVKWEGGHWIAVKNNQIIAHCDTEQEAYRELRS